MRESARTGIPVWDLPTNEYPAVVSRREREKELEMLAMADEMRTRSELALKAGEVDRAGKFELAARRFLTSAQR